jgi:hypothetical protein
MRDERLGHVSLEVGRARARRFHARSERRRRARDARVSHRRPCRGSSPDGTRHRGRASRPPSSRRSLPGRRGAGPRPGTRHGLADQGLAQPEAAVRRHDPEILIAPIGPRSITPCTVATYPSSHAISQVAPGRNPGLRRISRISRWQPKRSPRQGNTWRLSRRGSSGADLGVVVDERLLPGDPEVSRRQDGGGGGPSRSTSIRNRL